MTDTVLSANVQLDDVTVACRESEILSVFQTFHSPSDVRSQKVAAVSAQSDILLRLTYVLFVELLLFMDVTEIVQGLEMMFVSLIGCNLNIYYH